DVLLLRAGHCLALLSFPTRRSSDLPPGGRLRRIAAQVRSKSSGGSRKRQKLALTSWASGSGSSASIRATRQVRRRSPPASGRRRDRKSTRLNSSHVKISYAVFCLKK